MRRIACTGRSKASGVTARTGENNAPPPTSFDGSKNGGANVPGWPYDGAREAATLMPSS